LPLDKSQLIWYNSEDNKNKERIKMEKEKKIVSISIQQGAESNLNFNVGGYITAGRPHKIKEINEIFKHGEMAHVEWYEIVDSKDNVVAEVNGKHVTIIYYANGE
jgi:hypothetical protein